MKLTVVLLAIGTTFNQASPAVAQGAQWLLPASFRDAATPRESRFRGTTVEQSRTALDDTAGPERSASVVFQRSAQTMLAPHIHRNVSIRRLALGALIGGAAGAALGYGLATRSCGATASRQECVGYGRLGAVVMGGVGAAVGIHIAITGP